jgi:hypothetical protein
MEREVRMQADLIKIRSRSAVEAAKPAVPASQSWASVKRQSQRAGTVRFQRRAAALLALYDAVEDAVFKAAYQAGRGLLHCLSCGVCCHTFLDLSVLSHIHDFDAERSDHQSGITAEARPGQKSPPRRNV